jgi:hypothetical protein
MSSTVFSAIHAGVAACEMDVISGVHPFGLLLTSSSSYVGELPNSHGRTLTDKSYVIHGIRSILFYDLQFADFVTS